MCNINDVSLNISSWPCTFKWVKSLFPCSDKFYHESDFVLFKYLQEFRLRQYPPMEAKTHCAILAWRFSSGWLLPPPPYLHRKLKISFYPFHFLHLFNCTCLPSFSIAPFFVFLAALFVFLYFRLYNLK